MQKDQDLYVLSEFLSHVFHMMKSRLGKTRRYIRTMYAKIPKWYNEELNVYTIKKKKIEKVI